MKPAVIFFDIDDTLCLNGTIIPENREALRALKKAGWRLGIATGRNITMLPHDIMSLIKEGIFSTLVCANGQYNQLEAQLVSHYPVTLNEARQLIEIAQKYDLKYQQASAKQIAISERFFHYDEIMNKFDCFILDPHLYKKADIYQFSYFIPENFLDASLIQDLSALNFNLVYWRHLGADLIKKGHSKVRGISDICEALHCDLSQIMAFGDGLNDIEMLSEVGLGIAMGNGCDEAKKVAKYITTDIQENGIRSACLHFGLL